MDFLFAAASIIIGATRSHYFTGKFAAGLSYCHSNSSDGKTSEREPDEGFSHWSKNKIFCFRTNTGYSIECKIANKDIDGQI